MRIKRRRLLLALVSLMIVVLAAVKPDLFDGITNPPPSLQPGYYRVTDVADGDTVSVSMNGRTERIRLIGVDTPETHRPNTPVQCFGRAASDFTGRVAANQSLRLEADPQSTNRDRYDRLLRYAYLPDGRLLNALIISEGYGFAYTYFPFDKAGEFRELERLAKAAGKGLWSSCPVEPTDQGGNRTLDETP